MLNGQGPSGLGRFRMRVFKGLGRVGTLASLGKCPHPRFGCLDFKG